MKQKTYSSGNVWEGHHVTHMLHTQHCPRPCIWSPCPLPAAHACLSKLECSVACPLMPANATEEPCCLPNNTCLNTCLPLRIERTYMPAGACVQELRAQTVWSPPGEMFRMPNAAPSPASQPCHAMSGHACPRRYYTSAVVPPVRPVAFGRLSCHCPACHAHVSKHNGSESVR